MKNLLFIIWSAISLIMTDLTHTFDEKRKEPREGFLSRLRGMDGDDRVLVGASAAAVLVTGLMLAELNGKIDVIDNVGIPAVETQDLSP